MSPVDSKHPKLRNLEKSPNFRMLSFFIIVIIGFTIACTSDSSHKTSHPNILLIVADDLGYSDLGCYGGEIATPHLDQLAENGLRLTRFYNMGRCCPSRASILTGQYPHAVGLGHMTQDIGQPGYRGRVAEDASTIAEVLKVAGYRSFLAGKWHLGTEDPTQHGFEEFYGTLVSAKTFWEPDHFLRLPAGSTQRSYQEDEFYGTDAVTDHALDFLSLARETPDQPWFLYLAYNAPHFPLQAPKEDIAKYAGKYQEGWDVLRAQRLQKMKTLGIINGDTPLTPRSPYEDYRQVNTGMNPAWDSLPEDRRTDLAQRMAIYAAMIDRMDQNIGRVIEDLQTAKELENTLIIFLSDNGACAEWDPFGFDIRSSPYNILHKDDSLQKMGEPGTFHSTGSGWANGANTPWRMYKHYSHEGGINTPCIVHWPAGIARTNAIEHQPAHIIDLLPTFCEVAGVEPSISLPGKAFPGKAFPGKAFPGKSLLSLFSGKEQPVRALFYEHEGHVGMHEGKWKLVAMRGQPWELYDIEKDRTELNNLAGQHPEIVARMEEQWKQWAATNQVTPLPVNYGVDYLKADR